VPKLDELPQDELLILLATRFDLNLGGHFFWYTRGIVAVLNEHHPNYIVVAPKIGEMPLLDFVDSRWHFIDGLSDWGSDAGKNSPENLVKKLLPILLSKKQNSHITMFSIESSYSLIVALMRLQKKIPELRASITFLDHGFWVKLLTSTSRIAEFLVSRFLWNLSESSSWLKVLHPSISQHKEFSKICEVRVFPFSHISAFWKHSLNFEKVNSQDFKFLILPWRNDLETVAKFIESKPYILFKELGVHIHFKSQSDYQALKDRLPKELFAGLEVTVGTLQREDYIDLFQSSDLTWIPYADRYHQISGSGRAFDSITLGCPLIIDEGSDLIQMASGFPLLYSSLTQDPADILMHINFAREEKRSFDQYLKRRIELSKLGSNLFSPVNGVNSFLVPFDLDENPRKHRISAMDYFWLRALYYLMRLREIFRRIRTT
jgi:hypothetical protein